MHHVFGPEEEWPHQDLIAFSREFDEGLVLAAYQSGVFPMPLLESSMADEMGWWSPVQRGILPLDSLRITRSLRKSAGHYTTTVNTGFDQVLAACADPAREGAWITDQVAEVYRALHHHRLAHSVEVWDAEHRLVGGLYGVQLGGLFAGESMFHDPQFGRDASKVALLRLVHQLREGVADDDLLGTRLLDIQWVTDHLASLGAVSVPRVDYLGMLDQVLDVASPRWPTGEPMVMRHLAWMEE